jgi:ElaB/YqjD/DUF883 family membrane-anchored ribosome-binding protein
MNPQQKTGGLPADAPSKQELHAQIDETKSAIAVELKELGEKLNPDHLKEGVKDMIHEAKSEAKEALYEAKNAVVGSLRSAKDHAVDSVTETLGEVTDRARRAGRETADFASANAVPLALIGLGAGWLMLTMRRQRMMREERGWNERRLGAYERDYGEYRDRGFGGYEDRRFGDYGEREYGAYDRDLSLDASDEARGLVQRGKQQVERMVERTREGTEQVRGRVGETLAHVSERAGELSHEARSRASELSHEARVRASELSHQARMRFDRAQQSTREFANENPLAVSALAVAAGVGFGLMLPSSRAEDRLLGPTRGRLMGEARGLVDDAKQTAQHAAQAARETVSEVKQNLTSGPSH